MTTPQDDQQQFLITWYHPTEHLLAPETYAWVISSNDDFGYEVACAIITEASETAAKAFIRKSYPAPLPSIQFRSCTLLSLPFEWDANPARCDRDSLRAAHSQALCERRSLVAA